MPRISRPIELAAAVYTDKYALCKAFKQATGQTIMEYANRWRCARAAEQIAQGDTVAEAARKCGFDNLSFFSRVFKRYMNALPSGYKVEIRRDI